MILTHRVKIIDGQSKGKMGYAQVDDEDLQDVVRSAVMSRIDRANRYRGLWVTLDPEPTVTFGGSAGARHVTAWVLRSNVHVLTPLEEMADLNDLDINDRVCVCGHPRKVHFASRCLMPNCVCDCTSYKEKEET